MAIYTPREMNCLTEDGPPRVVIPETKMTGLLAPAKFRLFLPRCVYFVEISRAVLVIEGKRLAFKYRRCSTRLKFEKHFALIY